MADRSRCHEPGLDPGAQPAEDEPAAMSTTDDSSPIGPEHFGRYRLLERIGRGGMAEVFKAYIEGFEGYRDPFVIKRIRPEKSDRPDIVEMFCNEARICALLAHPNIVEMYDFGQIGGAYFMAMEYLRGRDLAAVMRALRLRLGVVPPRVAAHVAAEIARGLDHAHRATLADGRPAEIVHRDVTPSNVMLLAAGGVKVLDFGIAKAADAAAPTAAPRRGRVKGKLAYLSPEQVRGAEIDARSDVFSLGVVLWEMLAGQRLFAGDNEFQTLRNVLTAPVPAPSMKRPEVPAALDRLVARALARDPGARYASAAAFAEEAEAARGSALDGARGVETLLAELFGAAAAEPRDRVTAALTAVSLSSLDSEPRPRTTSEERALAELIATANAAAPSEPPVQDTPRPRRRLRRVVAVGAAVLVAAALAFFLR
jgi:serine/threonine protein kinase